MAGSFRHVVYVKNGKLAFRGVTLLDHLGDAYEALEEMFDMIEHLSGGDLSRIHAAHEAHCLKRYGGIHAPVSVDGYFEEDEVDEDDDDEDLTDGK